MEPFPPNYKAPRMNPYIDKLDPNDHIGLFLAILNSQNLLDSIFCSAFPSSIRGSTYRWFADQQAGSIISFVDLTCKFVTQHMNNIRIKKSTNSLNAIRQDTNTLREYTTKFVDTLPEILDFDGKMAINTFIMGLTPGSHLEARLSVQHVTTLHELLTRAKQYIE